jgi:hypothetical protein
MIYRLDVISKVNKNEQQKLKDKQFNIIKTVFGNIRSYWMKTFTFNSCARGIFQIRR